MPFGAEIQSVRRTRQRAADRTATKSGLCRTHICQIIKILRSVLNDPPARVPLRSEISGEQKTIRCREDLTDAPSAPCRGNDRSDTPNGAQTKRPPTNVRRQPRSWCHAGITLRCCVPARDDKRTSVRQTRRLCRRRAQRLQKCRAPSSHE